MFARIAEYNNEGFRSRLNRQFLTQTAGIRNITTIETIEYQQKSKWPKRL